MARKPKSKKKEEQSVLSLTPEQVIEQLEKRGTSDSPEFVRPGRCGGCDVRMDR